MARRRRDAEPAGADPTAVELEVRLRAARWTWIIAGGMATGFREEPWWRWWHDRRAKLSAPRDLLAHYEAAIDRLDVAELSERQLRRAARIGRHVGERSAA